MQEQYPLTGKYLPIVFVRGYIHGFFLVTQSDIWRGYYSSSVARFIPQGQQDAWLALLQPYYRDDVSPPAPLDYSALRLFQANMDEPKVQRGLTVRVGSGWWWGASPIATLRDYGLRRFFAPYLTQRIERFDSRQRENKHVSKVVPCIQHFVEALCTKSGIALGLHLAPMQITITIDDCPFCDESSNCLIFWGVMSGLLEWMHGKGTIAEVPSFIALNIEASTSHHLVLDILHPFHAVQL